MPQPGPSRGESEVPNSSVETTSCGETRLTRPSRPEKYNPLRKAIIKLNPYVASVLTSL